MDISLSTGKYWLDTRGLDTCPAFYQKHKGSCTLWYGFDDLSRFKNWKLHSLVSIIDNLNGWKRQAVASTGSIELEVKRSLVFGRVVPGVSPVHVCVCVCVWDQSKKNYFGFLVVASIERSLIFDWHLTRTENGMGHSLRTANVFVEPKKIKLKGKSWT